jgi:hypothetical protein
MYTLDRVLTLCLSTLLLLAVAPNSRGAESPLQQGEVGLFFDPAGTVDSKVVSGTFDVYLVARIPVGGLSSYWLVEPRFSDSSGVIVTAVSIPDGSEFSLQPVQDSCNRAVASAPPDCPGLEGEVVALARYTLQSLAGNPTICLENYQCPTIAGPAATDPGYESCDEPGVPRQFSSSSATCLSLDGSVPTARMGWGVLKTRFGRES